MDGCIDGWMDGWMMDGQFVYNYKNFAISRQVIM